ncbi:MAG: hypothetical protein JXA89_27785 [Anaerolineae bacterium]|nr:hypothetical protein [Anaerolineae bacterium]
MNKQIKRLSLIVLLILLPSVLTFAQTEVPLKNADMEGPPRQTLNEGTSVSSWLAIDWFPWSVLGDSVNNREVEYKLITLETGSTADLRSHVHGGNHAQQFFTNGGTHTAGFYQRVQVPANGRVTFTIWVQIQTGQKLIFVDKRYVSDLSGGGGNYYVQVGIDPVGATPAYFSAPLPDTIAWSEPVWDISAWGTDEKGNPADLWVPLSLTVQAKGEWVTVYTRGQCKYPTKYNTSFWDDASLTVTDPPTPTRPPPTNTPAVSPTNTPVPTETPTATPEATVTPLATNTPSPTPEPTHTATVTPTPTMMPTSTSTPDWTPTPTLIVALNRPTATPTLIVYPTWTPTPQPASRIPTEWIGIGVVALMVFVAMGALGFVLGRVLGNKH